MSNLSTSKERIDLAPSNGYLQLLDVVKRVGGKKISHGGQESGTCSYGWVSEMAVVVYRMLRAVVASPEGFG